MGNSDIWFIGGGLSVVSYLLVWPTIKRKFEEYLIRVISGYLITRFTKHEDHMSRLNALMGEMSSNFASDKASSEQKHREQILVWQRIADSLEKK